MSKRHLVALVGVGNVGSELLRQILDQRDLRVVAVANSRGAAVHSGGFARQKLLAVAQNRNVAQLRAYQAGDGESFTNRLFDSLSDQNLIIADVSSGDIGLQHRSWIRFGFKVATANKKPVTGPMSLWHELMAFGQSRYRFECTCGAWLPVVSLLQDLRATGDRILQITAAPSGSLGYIMSACDKGEDGRGYRLSAAILAARALGYTEPDPRDDLSLMDVARKALILARLSGQELELSDIQVENLVPEELRDVPLADFIGGLKLARGFAALAKRIADLRRTDDQPSDTVLRCLATVDDAGVRVGLHEVDQSGPFGRLTGTTNTFHITTERCADSRIAVYGPGAGANVTAAGVLSDILRIVESMR